MAISGRTLVVGARGASAGSGAVYVYDVVNELFVAKLKASDEHNFGSVHNFEGRGRFGEHTPRTTVCPSILSS